MRSATVPFAEEEKLDRRVRRTRRQLSEAMLSLLVERAYENITVQEITERADLNRATFYHHFSHKDELLAAALEARFDELVASFGELPTGKAIWQDRTPEILTFRHVAEYAPLYKVLFSERGMCHVVYRIINYIARVAQNKLLASQKEMLTATIQEVKILEVAIPEVVIANHVAGSLLALLSWWLANDMPYTPEKMAEMAHTLCSNGVASVLESG